MTKQKYGNLIITAIAEKDIINNNEGLLFDEFDELALKIDELVRSWNKRPALLELKVQEEDEVYDLSS